ncbi:secretogranin-1 [Rhinophrynus dorsalis]
MPPVVVLLSLLLGTLEVCAAPADKVEHPEEMVTRCIVEVLSNALAKPNAPPIDPECKEILKKSSRQSQDEKVNGIKQYETRNLEDVASTERHQHDIDEEIKPQNSESKIPGDQNEEKRHHMDSVSQEEKVVLEDGTEKGHTKEKSEDTGHSKETDFLDDEEEIANHKEHFPNEEIIKKNKQQNENIEDSRHDIFEKKIHTAAKSVEEFSEEDDEPRHVEEIMKRHHGNWKEHLNRPEKQHSPHSYEESKESDESEDEEKRSHKPKHNVLGQRFLDYDEKRSHHTEQRHQDDSNEINEKSHSNEQKRHFDLNSLEDDMKNHYEKRTYHEIKSPEESKEKRHFHRGSEEESESNYHSDEDNEKESKRNHYEELDDKRHHEERKKWPSERHEGARFNYEQSHEDSDESEDIDKLHAQDRKEIEKLYEKVRHLQESEEERPYKHERKGEDKRHYIGEEMFDEVKRYYPEHIEGKEKTHYNADVKSHHYGENKENIDKSNYLDSEKYKRHQSEEDRRPVNQYGFSDDHLKWKNRYFDKDDEGEEDSKRNVQSKSIFPDYNDYDWWGKRQFLEDINHGFGEKRSPPKIHKFDVKRQYDRMDELAQLLNYKKKSVEFPEFYDSEEIKKRHLNLNDRGSLGQRPLTEEEEKELENLAIMDLELQKIAEKLSNNRQG